MASLISRFAAVAAVSTGLAVISMETPANASAGGFTGSFANWTLTNYADYAPGSPFGAANNSATTVPGPPPLGPGQFTSKASTTSYQCSDPVLSVACVTDFNAVAGTATVVGSNYDPAADSSDPSFDPANPGDPTSTNGSPGQSWATQWEMTSGYSGSPDPYTFTFNWAFVPGDVSSDDQSYYYIVDGSNNLTTFTLGSGLASGSKTVTLNAGWKLGFGVYTLSNSGGPGNLAITSFNEYVPAPLPLLGVGAAFGWSRRLRSRIRVRTGVAIR